MADGLAGADRRQPFVGPEPYAALGPKIFAKFLAKEKDTVKKEAWETSTTGRHLKEVWNPLGRGEEILTLNRPDIKDITDFLTGHCGLNAHLHRIGRKDSPTCGFCLEEDETPIHIFTQLHQ